MNDSWEFIPMTGKKVPIHTDGFFTNYDQMNFVPEEVIIRESAQNAIDASKDNQGITELRFQQLSANKEKKQELIELFKFDKVLKNRIKSFEDNTENFVFSTALSDFFLEDTSIRGLLIRDYNTCGLGGRINSYTQGDHFARLVCATNLTDKAHGNTSSGGSHGLGKTAFTKSSGIYTVVYHSVFEPNEETDNSHRRLMCTGVYPRHIYKSKEYGGYAFYGDLNEENETDPFVDEEAELIWNRICEIFQCDLERKKDETGTDILIFMDDVDIRKLVEASETYYFPAIEKGRIAFRFIDSEGNSLYPNLDKRTDLDTFRRLHKLATNDQNIIKADNESLETIRVNSEGKRINLGNIALSPLTDDGKEYFSNCIALTRGTGMIINYINVNDNEEKVAGVFSADKEIYDMLILSENSAHSKWEAEAHKLNKKYSITGKSIINKLNNKIKERFRDFQNSLITEEQITSYERGILSKLLSKVFSGTGNTPPPEPGNRPLSLSLIRSNRDTDNSKWILKITENEYTPEESFQFTLRPTISIAGDSKLVPIKHTEISLFCKNDGYTTLAKKPEYTTTYTKGDTLEFEININKPGKMVYQVICNIETHGVPINVDTK